jgi:hypothetical protein
VGSIFFQNFFFTFTIPWFLFARQLEKATRTTSGRLLASAPRRYTSPKLSALRRDAEVAAAHVYFLNR